MTRVRLSRWRCHYDFAFTIVHNAFEVPSHLFVMLLVNLSYRLYYG